jgi:hypothetical protein
MLSTKCCQEEFLHDLLHSILYVGSRVTLSTDSKFYAHSGTSCCIKSGTKLTNCFCDPSSTLWPHKEEAESPA